MWHRHPAFAEGVLELNVAALASHLIPALGGEPI
jgi:hypothetical protein